MFECVCVCCYVICFGIVCVIFSQLLWFFLYFFAWFLNDAYSVMILVLFHLLRVLEIIFHFFVCSYKNLLQIPCRSQEKRKFTIFLLACLPFLSQPFGAVCVSSFPISISTFARRLSVFLSFIFFSVKIRKQDGFVSVWFRLFAYFLCFFVSVSDVSKGGETQNKNSVCCHFKLDLESKLKNSTALSARTQIKNTAYYYAHPLNKCASFLGRGRGHSSTTRGRGNRI